MKPTDRFSVRLGIIVITSVALFGLALGLALFGETATAQNEAASPPPSPAASREGELTVFAASSLTDALGETGEAFERQNSGTRIVNSFGGSSQLRLQIEQGARADIFVSADLRQIDLANAKGLLEGDAVLIARNRLVLVAPRGSPVRSLSDLATSGIKLVLATEEAPAGHYADALIAALSNRPGQEEYQAKVRANIVSREPNVRLVLAKVRLGEADAGFVYATDAQQALLKAPNSLLVIDPGALPEAEVSYYAARVRGSRQSALAADYLRLLTSPEVRASLSALGFLAPEKENASVQK